MSPDRPYRFAVATAAATWVLLLVGGLVHGTGSGLACPDWPTCYGSFFPRMTGGILFEHSHRLAASAVGLLTIALAVLLGRGRWKLGVAAVALVIFQGVLGGLTVLFKLPDLVSTAHLAVSMIFFLLLVAIAWRVAPKAPAPPAASSSTRRLASLATAAVYLQIVLGALVRHTESGLACGGWVLCHGSLWPTGAHPATRLHMAHRLGAVIVAALVVAAAVSFARRADAAPRLRLLTRALPLAVAAQIALGLASVRTGLSLWAVEAHLGLGAALLAGCFVLRLSLGGSSATAAARAPTAPARLAEADS